MPNKKRFHAFVSGRVQGVNFRNFTRRNARSMGIKGFVKNLADGRVEVVAEADHEKLKKFLEDVVKEGPSLCRVDDIEVNWEKPEGYNDFRVER